MRLIRNTRPEQLRLARQSLLESGEVPEGLIDQALIESWLRSRQAGLSPTEPPRASQSSSSEWRKALVREYDLLAHARPVMEFISEQMAGSGSMVVLADAQGMVLHSLGDDNFAERAERIALTTGTVWREDTRGTNAIGTSLVSQTPVVIRGQEHYLDKYGFMSGCAAPVMAPDGQLRGVLDIAGDEATYHPHSFALVKSAARMIEDRLFHARHLNDPMLRFHPRAEGLGALGEGLVALTEDGWVMGANAIAQQWLGLSPHQIGAVTLDKLLGPQAQRLLNLPATGQATRVTTMQGRSLYVRDEPDRRRQVWASTPLPDAGKRPGGSTATAIPPRPIREPRHDTRMTQALGRALRVQAQGIPVLLEGEAGTGKERFARVLHAQSERAAQPFVVVHCDARDATLLEAELFGYVAQAFAGARPHDTPGQIQLAHQGTLYLDAITELPMPLQTRLLQVLKENAVRPMGDCHATPVDIWLVCASMQGLREAVAEGKLVEELYWHLNGLTVHLPALRERGDFVELIDDLLHELGRDMKRQQAPSLADEVLQALQQHPWPGNLRQLHKVFRTACALLSPHEEELHWEHFGEDVWDDVFSRPYRMDEHEEAQALSLAAPTEDSAQSETNLKRLSLSAIERAIKACDGNLSQAAKRLGISRNTLYRRIKHAGKEPDNPDHEPV